MRAFHNVFGALLTLVGVVPNVHIVDSPPTQRTQQDSVKTGSRDSTPTVPQQQRVQQPQRVVKLHTGQQPVPMRSGHRGPGSGPPWPAYTFGQKRGGHSRRATKVRTHKTRCC